ncbi:MAG: B12-binding domain-containing radical SAM protein [Myxococcales bacterium]|nr:B12-binding domain-containing radical SAM protein [Myxococcales bacterium]
MALNVALVNPILSRDSEMSLGLLYVAEATARAGHRVRVLDTGFTRSPAHLWPALDKFAPDVVAFTVMSVTYPQTLRLAQEVKRRFGAKVVMGGPHATLYPLDVAGQESVDAAVVGDGDLSFPRLLDHIENGHTTALPGVAHTLAGELRFDPEVPRVADLDSLAFPDRSRYDALDAYIAAMGHSYLFGRRVLTMITSRGCPWDCSYCQPVLDHIHGKKVRIRSTDNVVSELLWLKNRHGINGIWFCDDTFTFDSRWVTELCQKMIDRRLDLGWSCNSRVDTVDPTLLALMARAGCEQLRFGMESGSQILLDRTMNKRTTVSECEAAFAWAKEAGIKTWAYTMVGGLDETRDTVAETRRLLERLEPQHIQITMLAPLPKTYFAEKIHEHKNLRVLPHGFDDLRLFDKCVVDTDLLTHHEVKLLQQELYADHPGFDPARVTPKERRAWALRHYDHVRALLGLRAEHPDIELPPTWRLTAEVVRAALGAIPALDPLRIWARRTLMRQLIKLRYRDDGRPRFERAETPNTDPLHAAARHVPAPSASRACGAA